MSTWNNSSSLNKIIEGTPGITVLEHTLPRPSKSGKYKYLAYLFYGDALLLTAHVCFSIFQYYRLPQPLSEYDFLITYVVQNAIRAFGALLMFYCAQKLKPRIMPEAYILRINDAVPANIILELQRYFMFTPYAGNHPDTWIASCRKTEEITNV